MSCIGRIHSWLERLARKKVFDSSEKILSNALGQKVGLRKAEDLSSNKHVLILRCSVHAPAAHPQSVIIKACNDDSDAEALRGFFSDWAGLTFLNSVQASNGGRCAPQVYGGERGLRLFVAEDLRGSTSLVQPLLEGDACSAQRALHQFAASLGRMHASTAGRTDEYEKAFQSLTSDIKPWVASYFDFRKEAKQFGQLLEQGLGIRMEAGFFSELEATADRIERPGPFLAYIHGDPCPDNVLCRDGQMKLIDFEAGRFGHALIDAVYGRMMFPTCWCANRIPGPVVAGMEKAYRSALAEGCPQAQEDRVFEQALATACAYWFFAMLHYHLGSALRKDWEWGISNSRQRILSRLKTTAAMAEELNQMPALRATAQRMLEALQRRWPETQPAPLYPAFRAASGRAASSPESDQQEGAKA